MLIKYQISTTCKVILGMLDEWIHIWASVYCWRMKIKQPYLWISSDKSHLAKCVSLHCKFKSPALF